MNIRLSDHFGYRRLLRFTLPSIVMMIFTSIYGVLQAGFGAEPQVGLGGSPTFLCAKRSGTEGDNCASVNTVFISNIRTGALPAESAGLLMCAFDYLVGTTEVP